MSTPPPSEPDSRDWTFVVREGCSECGYRPHDPPETAERLRTGVPRWTAVLERPDVAERPSPRVWSPLEYSAHASDLITVYGQRVAAMLREDEPVLDDYDGEAEARRKEFWKADPAVVAREISERTEESTKILADVGEEDWQRTGKRSDGFVFTIATLSQYILHDIEHHLGDVNG